MAIKIKFKLDPSEWNATFDEYIRTIRIDARVAFARKAKSISFGLYQDHRSFGPKIISAIAAVSLPGNPIKIRPSLQKAHDVRLRKAQLSYARKLDRMEKIKSRKAKIRALETVHRAHKLYQRLKGQTTVEDKFGRQTTDLRAREIAKRKKAAGYLGAKSWRLQGQTLDDLAPMSGQGRLRKNTAPDNLGVEIENQRPNMGDFVRRTKYTQRTLDRETEDMRKKILATIQRRLNA